MISLSHALPNDETQDIRCLRTQALTMKNIFLDRRRRTRNIVKFTMQFAVLLVLAAGLPGMTADDSERASIMAPVRAIIAGIAAHESAALAAQLRPDADITVAAERPDGSHAIRHLTPAEFSGSVRPGPERLEARLGEPVIQVDGDIAVVWVSYLFFRDDQLDHCGVNHFDLIRENQEWKVQNVTWSSRTTGCR